MSLVHHFSEQSATVNAWIVKSGFPNDEENSLRLALELGARPVSDITLDQAWARVQAKPAPAADVDIRALANFPALALAQALAA